MEEKLMLDKKLYEKYSLEIKENRLNEKELENLSNDVMNMLLQDYHQKKYNEVEQVLKLAKRFSSLFCQCIISPLSYEVGWFAAVIAVFELLEKSGNRKESFQTRMTALYEKSGVKEILEYIYKNPDSQHKTICEKTSVKNKSYLSQLLRQLEDAGCVERYSTGKRSFFSLSLEGQAFVKEKHQYKKTGEYSFLIRKYDLEQLENLQNNREDITINKYSKELLDRKYKNYA